MSKRYYYRRSKRTYPKQKWQITYVNPPLITVSSSPSLAAHSFWAKHQTICQSVVPTSASAASVVSANNIVKVANFKVKGSFNANSTDAGFFSMIIYVIFVPQGIQPDNESVSTDNLATSIFYSHPEWVMGWTRVDPDTQGSDHFTISSRLRRNLNSGDQIVLGVLLINDSSMGSTSFNVSVKATVQYCARAN